MSVYNIVPIEYEGMSIITVLVLFFMGVGFMAVLNWIRERFAVQDERLEEHDRFVNDIRGEFADNRVQCAEMKGTIKQTQTIVNRIDRSLERITETNTKVIESYLKRDN